MNQLICVSLLASAIVVSTGNSQTPGLIDSPGPGYRKQMERLTDAPARVELPPLTITNSTKPVNPGPLPGILLMTPEFPAELGERPFSTPIRLFQPAPQPGTPAK